MHQSLRVTLGSLPKPTRVYCGHEVKESLCLEILLNDRASLIDDVYRPQSLMYLNNAIYFLLLSKDELGCLFSNLVPMISIVYNCRIHSIVVVYAVCLSVRKAKVMI